MSDRGQGLCLQLRFFSQLPAGNRIRRSHLQPSFPSPAHTKSQWPTVRTNKSACTTSLLHSSSKFIFLKAFRRYASALDSTMLYFSHLTGDHASVFRFLDR